MMNDEIRRTIFLLLVTAPVKNKECYREKCIFVRYTCKKQNKNLVKCEETKEQNAIVDYIGSVDIIHLF